MPAAPGILQHGPCRSGVEDTLRMALPAGVAMLIRASPADIYPVAYRQIALEIRFLIPDGVSLQLVSSDVVLESTAWAGPRNVPIVKIVDWTTESAPAPSYAPLAVLRGSPRTGVYPGFQLALVAVGPREQTSVPIVESFEVHVPAMRVNGTLVTSAAIAFSKYTENAVTIPCD